MILFLNENDLFVSFLNLWGVRSQCCDHLIHPCSSATTDLSLATLLKTAVFVSFFLTRNAFIKMRNRCICLHPNQTRLFRRALQLCLSARRESNERGKGTPAKWASVEQRDAVRLYVSKTNFPVLSADTVLTAHALIASSNKRTRNYEHTTWNYQKRRFKLQTVHAFMNALHFRTSLSNAY